MEDVKPIHTLVLDAGAIIKNEPPVSTLLKQSESLVTVPAIIAEIKDAAARSRVETTLRPFLTLRTPSPSSIKFVTDFARRTGDLAVLSRPDIEIIALTYEIECERNGGDWRLRRAPGQKRVNGAPPSKVDPAQANGSAEAAVANSAASDDVEIQQPATKEVKPAGGSEQPSAGQQDPLPVEARTVSTTTQPQEIATSSNSDPSLDVDAAVSTLDIDDKTEREQDSTQDTGFTQNATEFREDASSSDSEGGWITPSNLKKRQLQDDNATSTQTPEPATMQVAVLTSDFAMQNVILQINLNLLSSSLSRVKQLKTFVLRCHACFQNSKDMTKQFCPKCGQPSLTRVSCSTNANGEFKLHLKKNMQWNNRGDRYSIPKPVHGSSNGRVKGGGKGGWGNDLILAEDQKEYQRAATEAKRHKERSLMDEDYLPGILTGERGRAGGRIKVGAGRNINAKKR